MAHDLRLFIRMGEDRAPDPSAVIMDARTLQSTPESGHRAGYDGHNRKKGSKLHMVVATLGHLLTLKVTAANAQERAQVEDLAAEVQALTSGEVEICFVDQGYTGDEPKQVAAELGIQLEVIKLPDAKRGFVLPAPALGRGTKLRVDHPLPAPVERLRAITGDLGRAALSRVRVFDAPESHRPPQ